MFIVNNEKPEIQTDGNQEFVPSSLSTSDNPAHGLRFRQVDDFITFEKEVWVQDGTKTQNYPVFYTATAPCFLIEARLRHEINGGSGAIVDVVKVPNAIAKNNGQSMLASKFDISAGLTNVQVKGVTIVLAGYQLVPGDSMALKASGTLINASNICVGVLMGIQAKNFPTGQSTTVVLVGL